jgi:hypothetical protein
VKKESFTTHPEEEKETNRKIPKSFDDHIISGRKHNE